MENSIKKFILVTPKSWHKELFKKLEQRQGEAWVLITEQSEFNLENLNVLQPNIIFIPHWSYIIPSSIYNSFKCVLFHMTDLPYGRGGSPLQNLIVRGHKTTKISAIKITQGIDTGDIYLKSELLLEGTAYDIFKRSAYVIGQMIENILDNNLQPQPQFGEVVLFKRRKPEDGNICNADTIEQIHDFIRMLDCEGYPNAYFENNGIKIEFSNSKIENGKIIANAVITKK